MLFTTELGLVFPEVKDLSLIVWTFFFWTVQTDPCSPFSTAVPQTNDGRCCWRITDTGQLFCTHIRNTILFFRPKPREWGGGVSNSDPCHVCPFIFISGVLQPKILLFVAAKILSSLQILTHRAVFICIKCINIFCPLKIYHHYPWHNLF